jgi:hypothetical protein
VLPILAARGVWQHPDRDHVDGIPNVTPFAPTSGASAAS